MAKTANSKKRISVTVIVAIIGLIGICVTTLGTMIVGVFPSLLDVVGLGSVKEQSLTFRVTETNGTSIAQAKIILLSESDVYNQYTDSNGTAVFITSSGKTLRVFVESSQYEVYDQLIPNKFTNPIEIRLSPKDVSKKSIIIRVLDSQDSTPVRGAEVVFVANGNVYSQIADSNGITKFITGFPSDEIEGDISVSFNGFTIEHQRVTLQADRVQDISLDKEAGTVNVRLTGEQPALDIPPSSTNQSDVRIANDVPGTTLSVGSSITSTIDKDSKARDVYAIDLISGQSIEINVSSTKNVSVYIHKQVLSLLTTPFM
jgi:hypothetical protein